MIAVASGFSTQTSKFEKGLNVKEKRKMKGVEVMSQGVRESSYKEG